MLKLLQILGYGVFILAIAASGYLLLNHDNNLNDAEQFLASPQAAQEFADNLPTAAARDGSKAPLLVQAEQLSKRLNPPSAPPTSRPRPPSNSANTGSTPPPAPRPTAAVIAKFDLLGTCVNHENPSLSMAYVDIPGENAKWVYQGDTIGRLKVAQVKNESIVYNDGENETELMIKRSEPMVVSLLKSDHPEPQGQPNAPAELTGAAATVDTGATAATTATPAKPTAKQPPKRSGASRSPAAIGAAPATQRPPTEAIKVAPPVADPQQQRENLQEAMKMMQQWSGEKGGNDSLKDAMQSLQKMMGNQSKEQPKEQTEDKPKEQAAEQSKSQPKEQPKEQPTEQPKEQDKEQSKSQSKDQSKEESK